MKKADFHLDKAAAVEVKEPEWLIPGYIPKYGITTIAGEGGVGYAPPRHYQKQGYNFLRIAGQVDTE